MAIAAKKKMIEISAEWLGVLVGSDLRKNTTTNIVRRSLREKILSTDATPKFRL